ncbi:hypothetical protein AMATHDRAFT_6233 [Amanita thiersii Skay4041]|uniref:Uncharacterized protein n=1 Tax=Amanita thiersii Skay4041 TaxID=703135 RepID=A0A2A9ND25_9AGAR|nr:hypothetical protein AMATHDRAFT_6233 [Amanita thiersii Skay4041]
MASSLPLRRIAIVTGAASGIGRAIAVRLANDGFHIALNDLQSSHDGLSKVASQINSEAAAGGGEKAKAIIVPGDVSSDSDMRNLVSETVKELGAVDAMVANAGIVHVSPIIDMTPDQWDRMLSVHARGVFLCYKHAATQMIKQGRGGRLVGASSAWGKQGAPNVAHYCAAKFAVRGLTQSVAKELGKYGITANAYAPGITRTKLLDDLGSGYGTVLERAIETEVAMGREGQPEDIANVVSFLLDKRSDYITEESSFVGRAWG